MLLNRFFYSLSSIAILLSSCMLISACSEPAQPGSKPRASTHLVETANAQYQNISASRTLTGTLQAIREVKIINQTEGLLIELAIYPGDRVKKGQTLARLNDSLLKAEVQKATATLRQASVDLKRLKDLAPRKMASESEVAQAQTRKDIAAAELQLKQTEYQHTQIKAPINGIISERLAEPGDVIPLHSHLLTIIDTSSLKAEIYLSELLLPLIRQNNPVKITIDALAGQQFTGKIKRIFPSIDETTRRGTIEVILSPVPDQARAGQLCRVTIETQNKSRLMIPYDAVRHDKQGEYVYVLHNNQVQRVKISSGLQHKQLIEIIYGLKEQQEVISKGFFGLKDKMKVKKVETTKNDHSLSVTAPQKES